MDVSQTRDHKRCMDRAAEACRLHPIGFLLHKLKTMGCEVSLDNERLLCEPCGKGFLGGFDPDAKEVILCEDNLTSQRQLNRILTHELIHAYDVCRTQYDSNNLQHLACSEIRAANLSGDCEVWQEKLPL